MLRLLLAAATKLGTSRLAAYLETTLENSKRSRKKLLKKRKYLDDGDDDDYEAGGALPLGWALGYGSTLSDIGSDGWPGILSAKKRGADKVKAIYAMFASRLVPESLDRTSAPALHAYLTDMEAPAADAATAAGDSSAPPAAGSTSPGAF